MLELGALLDDGFSSAKVHVIWGYVAQMGNRVPIFVLAGQSNAEGNVRLEAIRDALPSHEEPLNSMERAQLRAAYLVGTGDWCNPAEDYSDDAADAAIDALRASGLDLSAVSDGAKIVTHAQCAITRTTEIAVPGRIFDVIPKRIRRSAPLSPT